MATGDSTSTILDKLYSPRTKRISNLLGIHVLLAKINLLYYIRKTDGTAEIEVGEASATFDVSYLSEYTNVRNVEHKERFVVERLVDELEADDVFWDVGANIGTFSCLAGSVLDDGTVVAFEPYGPNVERLEHNLEANDAEYAIEEVALSDANGDATFFAVDTDEPGVREGSIDSSYASTDRAVRNFTVETRTGDDLVASGRVDRPNVVKMDVEGSAPAVIEGMERTVRHPDCRLVVVEPHDNLDRITDLLGELGFEVEIRRVEGSPRVFGYKPDGSEDHDPSEMGDDPAG